MLDQPKPDMEVTGARCVVLLIEPSGSGGHSAREHEGRRGCGLAGVGAITLRALVPSLL